jgi:hypothetical protein
MYVLKNTSKHDIYQTRTRTHTHTALLTAIFSQWSKSPKDIKRQARESMRYVVFDKQTRLYGFSALLREDWANLYAKAKESAAANEALEVAKKNAADRFKLSKKLDPTDSNQQVDFFVSHNWCDDNAPHRWGALLQFSDLFYKK